jgi:hypothetical protein
MIIVLELQTCMQEKSGEQNKAFIKRVDQSVERGN